MLSLPHRQEGLQLEFEAQKQVKLPSKMVRIGRTGLAYFLPQYVVNIYVLSNFPSAAGPFQLMLSPFHFVSSSIQLVEKPKSALC